MIENFEFCITNAAKILGLIVTTMTFIIKFTKSTKARKIAEQAIEISNIILPYIKEAEKFTAFSSEEKKAYVMTKANQFTIENNMLFNEKQVSEKIEEGDVTK